MNRQHSILIACAAIIAFSAGLVFSNMKSTLDESDLSVNTLYYKQPRIIEPFSLIDEAGNNFTNQHLKGKWSLLFLGYLSCPDVCPTTMMKLTSALPELIKAQPNTQVLLLSVDPKRDTSSNIKKYTEYFHDDIIGLRAEHKELYPFVRNLGLMYSIPPQEVLENYYVDHSGTVVLLNPNAEIHAMFKPEVLKGKIPSINPQVLVADFIKITSL